jgi:histidyl-tRNA synthetase
MPDLFPEDLKKWHLLEKTISKVFHSFNTQEIRTPLLESTELFSRSVGNSSDIVNKELYSFLDKNEESISLRPEGSASVIRAIIQKKQEHMQQKLWYQGPMFRYERPQKGRFRQFHQVGVEYLGYEEGIAEYELLSMVLDINKSLGIRKYTIKINHLGDTSSKEDYCKALELYLTPHINELHEKDIVRLNTNPLRVLDSKEKSTLAILEEAPKFQDYLSEKSKSFLEMLVTDFSTRCDIEIDLSLVRGLDYYTGVVFEIISPELGAQNTFLGGGRYDNLSNQLGGKQLHAVGFAIGLERMLELITVKNDIPEIKVALIISVEHNQEKTYKIADDLRQANNKVILDTFLSNGSFKSQMRKANKNNCDFAVIIGNEELESNRFIWKDLSDQGDQQLFDLEALVETYRNL